MADMKELSMNELDQVIGGSYVHTGTDDKAQVRMGPESGWKRLVSIPNGTTVTRTGGREYNSEKKRYFVSISFTYGGITYSGWMAESMVKD